MPPDRSDVPPVTPPITVAPLRCGNCGGSFQEGDAACPWCGAGIALEDRGRSHVCARCALRAPTGAAWCPGCGERLGEQPIAPRADGALCPACRGELRDRHVGRHVMTECGGCGGLWLAARVLDELCGAAERAAIASGAAAVPTPIAVVRDGALERVTYRKCPACRELMARRNHGGSSGVVVDVCRHHGVWLDASELERVLLWIRAGGAERERRRRSERERDAARRKSALPPPPATSAELWPEPVGTTFSVLEVLAWLLKRFG